MNFAVGAFIVGAARNYFGAKRSPKYSGSSVRSSNSRCGAFVATVSLVVLITVMPLAFLYLDIINTMYVCPLLFIATLVGALSCVFVFKNPSNLCSKRNFFVTKSLNTEYGSRSVRYCFGRALDICGPYEVYLGVFKIYRHWVLFFKPVGYRLNHLPILSIEISTDYKLSDVIPVMKTHEKLPTEARNCKGSANKSLRELCSIGDDVIFTMKKYALTTSNCQTFCNDVLKKLDLEQEPTTAEMVNGTVIRTVVTEAVEKAVHYCVK